MTFDLIWSAHFADATVLNQYNDDGTENKFQEVLDRQDHLIGFALLNTRTLNHYTVDLKKGCVFSGIGNGQPFLQPREDMLRKESHPYRLIYFREVERTFGSTLQEIEPPKVLYFLGYQYTDAEEKNHKYIMKIHPDGRFVII